MSKYRSIFEIIGPVMVGPSSSHTAGAVRIGQIARNIYGNNPTRAEITFYGSFAHTYSGHGTDVAIIAGIMKMETFDSRIPTAYREAEKAGLAIEIKVSSRPVSFPNTAKVELFGKKDSVSVVGISIGGGIVQIVNVNGFDCHITGDNPAILVFHKDVKGRIAAVTNLIAEHEINVSHLEVSRHQKGEIALMILQTDEHVAKHILKEMREIRDITRVIQVKA